MLYLAFTILTLASIGIASPLSKYTRGNPHEAQFRTFGLPGCSADNQGVWVLLQSDAGTCTSFGYDLESLLVREDDVTNKSCVLTLYTEDACSSGPKEAVIGCNDGDFKSFKLSC